MRGKGSVELHHPLYDTHHPPHHVSVPLRGKGSVERGIILRVGSNVWPVFPSPCGERVLLNNKPEVKAELDVEKFFVSVPLRGKGSVELKGKKDNLLTIESNEVSVPLRGKGSVEL